MLRVWRHRLRFAQGPRLVADSGRRYAHAAAVGAVAGSGESPPDLHPLSEKYFAFDRDALLCADLTVGAREGLVAKVDERAEAVEGHGADTRGRCHATSVPALRSPRQSSKRYRPAPSRAGPDIP